MRKDPQKNYHFQQGTLELLWLLIRQKPKKSDAIVLLQGDRYDRCEKAIELFKKRYAPVIVITGNNVLIGKGVRPDENNVSLERIKKYLERSGIPSKRILLEEQSMNTRGQAIHTFELAIARGWKRLILIASLHHQFRAFLTFAKRATEVGWRGEIINQPQFPQSFNTVPAGRASTVSDIFWHEELHKFHQYTMHVISIQEGIRYLRRQKGEKYISLRRAQFSDWRFLFHLRNDSSARLYFLHTNTVTVKEHKEWLRSVLQDPSKALFILILESGTPIGQIRFDIKDEFAEISITVAKSYRGKGYGTIAIEKGICRFFEEHTSVKIIVAHVKRVNVSSQKVFKKLGFIRNGVTDGLIRFEFQKSRFFLL